MTLHLMCIYLGHKCMFVPNIKFLCLNLWLGELCTDANDTNDANANDRWTKHDHMRLFGSMSNEPKNDHTTDRQRFVEHSFFTHTHANSMYFQIWCFELQYFQLNSRLCT